MSKAKMVFATFGMVLLGASLAPAAVIVDANTLNGDFELDQNSNPITNGGWGAGAAQNPLNWTSNQTTVSNPFNVTATPMIYWTTEAYNNTGVTVSTGDVFTVNADAESVKDATGPDGGSNVYVDVVATQNADGTGSSVVLATASLTAGTQSGPSYSVAPTLIAMAQGVSSPANVSVNGYYVQVRTRSIGNSDSNYYWVDNVVVSSAVPEPASMGLLLVGGLLTLRRRRSSI
ncbi:MAG: PEP-CTERM sorting domain-containing protein [Phycisphaerales bacterium]|nr:PEP-CTERM sorting domain-containing protein [Phycisphaerales bacterium]